MTKKSSFARRASAKKKTAKSRRPTHGRGQGGGASQRRRYGGAPALRRSYAPTAEGIFHGTARGLKTMMLLVLLLILVVEELLNVNM